jgi:hypothetical protein
LYDEAMKHYIAIIPILLITAFAGPTQGVEARDRIMADSAALGETSSQLSWSTLSTNVPFEGPITVPSEPASSAYFRDVPLISGRYSIGGRALVPYLGAGFSGGYGSEFNRFLGVAPPTQNDFGLRNQLGQSVSPNEFQMGVRIPF